MEELGEKIRKLDPYLKDMSFLKPAAYKYEASAVGAALMFIENLFPGSEEIRTDKRGMTGKSCF